MVNVPLDLQETDALGQRAKRNRRNPRDEAAYIIRCQLEQDGLLPSLDRAKTSKIVRQEMPDAHPA
jgi:hypothetical protein